MAIQARIATLAVMMTDLVVVVLNSDSVWVKPETDGAGDMLPPREAMVFSHCWKIFVWRVVDKKEMGGSNGLLKNRRGEKRGRKEAF